MAYIEDELRKRKGPNESVDVEQEVASLDPRDALYKVAEKYRIEKKQVEEGNVTLSAAMLTAIPEVDLGIECAALSYPHRLGPRADPSAVAAHD